MQELATKEKQRIGKLLKYYRKKNKIHWKEIEKICSPATYSKLEKGNTIKNSTIYDELFDLFQITYNINPNFDNWLNNYLIRMNNILEWYKEEEFDYLINELEEELGPYKNNIIYQQYYQIITYILNYYKYSKYMKLEEIEDCFNLFESFDFEETIMIYLTEVTFISNNNSINNQHIFEKTLPLIEKYQNTPIIWYIRAFYYKLHAMFDSSLAMFNKSFEYYDKMSNSYRLSKSLIGKYIIYVNIDFKKAEETENLLIQLKQKNKINESMIPNINFNIGMNSYLNNNYEKSYRLFMENINAYLTKREWFYICAICTQLNFSIPKEFENYNVQENEDPEIMEYFRMKYNKYTNKKLVDYIMKTIVPKYLIYQNYRQPYWAVFEEELLAFSKKDKRFADDLIHFLDLEKKACKRC